MRTQEIARKFFYSLQRSTFYNGEYLVLNDQNFVARFRAENDAQAIKIFKTGAYKHD